MKLSAVERGEVKIEITRPGDSDTQRLVRQAADIAGNLSALARYLDVAPGAPGNWLHGRHRPSKRYETRMRALVERGTTGETAQQPPAGDDA